MGNMFAQAWRYIPAKTSTPTVSKMEILAVGPDIYVTTIPTVTESIPVQEYVLPTIPDVPHIQEALKVAEEFHKDIEKSGLEKATENLLEAMENKVSGPVEVNLDQEEDDWNKHGLSPVIVEEKFVDIDTQNIISAKSSWLDLESILSSSETSHGVTQEDIVEAQADSYIQITHNINKTLRNLGTATTEEAYTYGIDHLYNMKKDIPDDFITAHIFGPSYDLWISEYDETNRDFYGFASVGGILDYNAEWGYVSIDELLGIGPFKMERDFYWTPTELQSLINHQSMKEDEAEEQLHEHSIKKSPEVEKKGLSFNLAEETIAIKEESSETTHWDTMTAMFKDPDLIMMAGGYYYGWNDLDCKWIIDPRSAVGNKLEADDAPDIYFNTVEYRDKYAMNHSS